MDFKERLKEKLKNVLKTYEQNIKLEDHIVPESNLYQFHYFKQMEDRFDFLDFRIFNLPQGMSKENAFKVLSYMLDYLDNDPSLNGDMNQKLDYINKILSEENEYGFESYYGFASTDEVTHLFVVDNGLSYFKKSEAYSKYFHWYVPGVTKKEVEQIYYELGRNFKDTPFKQERNEQIASDNKKLEKLFEEYIMNSRVYESEIWKHLEIFTGLSHMLGTSLSKFYFENKDIDFFLPYLSSYEMIELTKKFYLDLGMELNIDELISGGIIEFEESTHKKYDTETKGVSKFSWNVSEEDKNNPSLEINFNSDDLTNYNLPSYGKITKYDGEDRMVTYPANRKTIKVGYNGTFLNLTTLIHELSHFKNHGHLNRNEVSSLLTETLSSTEELISADYFKENGFENEGNTAIKDILLQSYAQADKMFPIYKLLLLYRDTGSVSCESYEKYYNNRYYIPMLKSALGTMSNPEFDIEFSSRYLLAYSLAPYLFSQYKTNPKFIEVIQGLHKSINTYSLEECLSIMGATDYGKEDAEQLRNAIIELRDSTLENDKTKTH